MSNGSIILLLLLYLVTLTNCISVLQLTDLHMDKNYRSFGGDPKQNCHYSGQRTKKPTIGSYGDYECDSPKALIKYILHQASRFVSQPDFIIWNGDSFPHHTQHNITDVINLIHQIIVYIKAVFPKIHVFPVFGGQDYEPSEQLPDFENLFYNSIFKNWKEWITAEAMQTFRRAGYYATNFNGRTVILGLNTPLYARSNKQQMHNPDDPGEQFLFMRRQLEDARENNRTVHLIGHIPPGAFEQSPYVTWYTEKFNEKFVEILVEYSDVIRSSIFGHAHHDSFRLIKDKNNTTVTTIFIAPSVAPARSHLPHATTNNPAFRVIEYDNDWHITDIKQYYVDLKKLNKDPSVLAELEYSFRTTYKIKSPYITVNDMDDLVARLKTDPTVFEKYSTYNTVSTSEEPFKDQLRDAHLCALEYVDYNAYLSCLERSHVTTPTPQNYAVPTTDPASLITILTFLFLTLQIFI